MSKSITVLGIETSCDETAAAIINFDGRFLNLLSSITASQIPIHRLTGGVVPEVAAREHVTVMMPVIKEAFKKAKIKKTDVDAVAVTFGGPSLLPALLVGIDTANALALASNIPLVRVHHTTGHIYANFISTTDKIAWVGSRQKGNPPPVDINKIKFPVLALSVSGGHTELIYLKSHLNFKKVGATLDDAAGEAFDKTAKVLGLPYPGGPEISKLAPEGNPAAYNFPRPMLRDKSLNFSFAGLKTAVLYTAQKMSEKTLGAERANLAASIQQAIVDSLVGKTLQ